MEISPCAIKEIMFFKAIRLKTTVLNKNGHGNKILCYHYNKNGGKQIITVSSELKVICILSVNELTVETQTNAIFDQRHVFFSKIL